MKVGIMSDSHDNMKAVRRIVDWFLEKDIDLLIHAGDIVAPFVFNELERLDCEFRGVFGNNDGEKKGLVKRAEKMGIIKEGPYMFEKGGKKFVVAHEEEKVEEYKNKDVDYIIFGHSHELVIREGSPMIINPGEACGYLTGKASAVILDTETNKVEVFQFDI